MATPEVRAFLEGLLYEEAVPTLEAIPDHPREDYARVVLERFANTGVRDQIARLCIDGTSKFPTFLIPTLVRAVQDDTALDRAACALAGWVHYLADLPAAGRRGHEGPGSVPPGQSRLPEGARHRCSVR
jgi:mannitol 2-dehydrogenase